jgi:uroporphyrinogen-III synthase
MSEKGDLQGQTIVFTGQPKSNDVFLEVERLGGEIKTFPLIRTQEVTHQDEEFMTQLHSYDWLIFTSQNAVDAFENKITRHKVCADSFRNKVAAVGSQTARALEKIGLHVTFIPTIFSANEFVIQFPQISSRSESCLFIKGSLSKETIKEGLTQEVDEWTVYETLPDLENTRRLSSYIEKHPNVFVAFASPSSVDIFAQEIARYLGWDQIKIAAIGHVTSATLNKHGAPVHVQPKTYTWLTLIKEIANWKDDSLR